MGGVDPLIDEPPHRGRRRGGAERGFPVTAPLPDAVDAVRPVSHRSGQIGEDRARLIGPRAAIRVGPPTPAPSPSRHATRHLRSRPV